MRHGAVAVALSLWNSCSRMWYEPRSSMAAPTRVRTDDICGGDTTRDCMDPPRRRSPKRCAEYCAAPHGRRARWRHETKPTQRRTELNPRHTHDERAGQHACRRASSSTLSGRRAHGKRYAMLKCTPPRKWWSAMSASQVTAFVCYRDRTKNAALQCA